VFLLGSDRPVLWDLDNFVVQWDSPNLYSLKWYFLGLKLFDPQDEVFNSMRSQTNKRPEEYYIEVNWKHILKAKSDLEHYNHVIK